MPRVVAVVLADDREGRLGAEAALDRVLAGRTVLRATIDRAARVRGVEAVVVAHRPGADLALPRRAGDPDRARPVLGAGVDLVPLSRARRAARAWSLGGWRGGLGGATCYDELLPAGPLLEAVDAAAPDAEAMVLVGGDWPVLDPSLTGAVLAQHLEAPEARKLTFCQAPPGLAGCAVGRPLLEQMRDRGGDLGSAIRYAPSRPQADPIGREVCVPIDHRVRDAAVRFIDDTPRSRGRLDRLAAELGEALHDADARVIADAWRRVEGEAGRDIAAPRLAPQQVTLELTARRSVRGPVTQRDRVTLDRPDMATEQAIAIVRQVAASGDAAILLGGLGDALLHPGWPEVVAAARDAGALAVGIQTDLLLDHADEAERIVDSGVDVIEIRLNADRAATYANAMGSTRFAEVIDHIQAMLKRRQARPPRDLPWIVPSLVKHAETLADMESFFDRWMHFLGAAAIHPEPSGAGLAPVARDGVITPLTPPRRGPCRQLGRRLTVLSDGTIAQCDQDWLGRAAAGRCNGDAGAALVEATVELASRRRRDHAEPAAADLCAGCDAFHRP